VEEEGVEVVDVEELELVLDIADDIFGGAGVVELERGEDAVEAEAGGDDDAVAVDPLEGEAELAEGVAVAAGAVEVVDTEVDGMVDEGDGGVIGDIAEVVAEALGTERDDRDRQPRLSPISAGNGWHGAHQWCFPFNTHLVTAGADPSPVSRTGPGLTSVPGGNKARWVGSGVNG
jgi:hypothetical protein